MKDGHDVSRPMVRRLMSRNSEVRRSPETACSRSSGEPSPMLCSHRLFLSLKHSVEWCLDWQRSLAAGRSRHCAPLHDVTPLDPSCLAWTVESLLRCRSDASSHNSRIQIGAVWSMSDAMVDNGLAPVLSVSSAQANAGADSRYTFPSLSLVFCRLLGLLCDQRPSLCGVH